MKNDEKEFLISVYQNCKVSTARRKTPRDLINHTESPIYYKRAWYLLAKWCNKGWYDYGITEDLGWLTKKGEQQAMRLLKGE